MQSISPTPLHTPLYGCFYQVRRVTVCYKVSYREVELIYLNFTSGEGCIGRTDAVAETPILWLPGVKS